MGKYVNIVGSYRSGKICKHNGFLQKWESVSP